MNSNIVLFLSVIWFLMPSFFANMAPVFANRIFGKKGNPINKKIFGENKTYRGLISGVILSIIIIYVQYLLYPVNTFKAISILNYGSINLIIYGFLFGFGSMIGDLIKSFFKRRLGIKPGSMFMPFDQIDYILGTFLFLSIVYFPGWVVFCWSLLISFLGNILVNLIAYYVKLRDTKF